MFIGSYDDFYISEFSDRKAPYIKTEFQGPKEYSNSENVTYPYIVVKIQQTDKSVIFSE